MADHIDLSKYFVAKGYKTGRPRCDEQKLLKVIFFAFMEHDICSLRKIEKLCRNDIRYRYLLDGMKAPLFVTFGNIIRNELVESIDQIFLDVNQYIFKKDHTYVAVIDVNPYASDMECFVPLMEKFNKSYGHYPKYPVADAGYGSYNNYLYCEEKVMEKYRKFTMFAKETKDKKYHNDPFRAVNFKQDEDGNRVCPNGKRFFFKQNRPVYKNKYGRTEGIYE